MRVVIYTLSKDYLMNAGEILNQEDFQTYQLGEFSISHKFIVFLCYVWQQKENERKEYEKKEDERKGNRRISIFSCLFVWKSEKKEKNNDAK